MTLAAIPNRVGILSYTWSCSSAYPRLLYRAIIARTDDIRYHRQWSSLRMIWLHTRLSSSSGCKMQKCGIFKVLMPKPYLLRTLGTRFGMRNSGHAGVLLALEPSLFSAQRFWHGDLGASQFFISMRAFSHDAPFCDLMLHSVVVAILSGTTCLSVVLPST